MGDGKCHMKGAEAKKDGEEFNIGHLRYKCLNGIANITGCQLDGRRPLNVGDEVEKDGTTFKCFLSHGGIEYSEYTPAPNPIDDIKKFERGSFAHPRKGETKSGSIKDLPPGPLRDRVMAMLEQARQKN
ncbi:hypothetical protein AAVH_36796 [Aphelenchoides avenae]|nr:hypothetical protein AAVH_36796 [Aphelenchus avenae]